MHSGSLSVSFFLSLQWGDPFLSLFFRCCLYPFIINCPSCCFHTFSAVHWRIISLYHFTPPIFFCFLSPSRRSLSISRAVKYVICTIDIANQKQSASANMTTLLFVNVGKLEKEKPIREFEPVRHLFLLEPNQQHVCGVITFVACCSPNEINIHSCYDWTTTPSREQCQGQSSFNHRGCVHVSMTILGCLLFIPHHPSSPHPHADEAALYDRQIRLWGLEAQQKWVILQCSPLLARFHG
jgi:hypothetical protein